MKDQNESPRFKVLKGGKKGSDGPDNNPPSPKGGGNRSSNVRTFTGSGVVEAKARKIA